MSEADDGLVNATFTCRKCGSEVVCALEEGVTPIAICPACRLTPEQRQALEEFYEDAD